MIEDNAAEIIMLASLHKPTILWKGLKTTVPFFKLV